MSLELSLYTIESDLANLIEMREEALENFQAALLTLPDGATSKDLEESIELETIEAAIREYIGAEIRKVDGIRSYWRHAEMMRDAAKAEADVQAARAKAWDQRLKRLKDMCLTVMETIPFPPGKPKKLEGRTGVLMLKGNGGKQAVEIHDEVLVPDELQTITVTMLSSQWNGLLPIITNHAVAPELFLPPVRISLPTPSLSLIGAELERACEKCKGEKLMFDPEQPGPELNEKSIIDCDACAGSGKRGVPGARLAPRGSHVECR